MRLLVEAAGENADDAVKLMIADKLEELTRIQVEAIKNIKIDKVTVWDGNGGSENGKTATANFLSGMMKSIPPMNELFQQAGMELPEFLGRDISGRAATLAETTPAVCEKEAEEPAEEAPVEVVDVTAEDVVETDTVEVKRGPSVKDIK